MGCTWIAIGSNGWAWRMEPDRGWSVRFSPGRDVWVATHPGPITTVHMTEENAKHRCEEEMEFRDAVAKRVKEECNVG